MPDFSFDYYGSTNNRDGQCENCMMREAFKKVDTQEVPSKEHLKEVCKFTQGRLTCRYLCMHPGKETMEHCAKGSDLQSTIDARGDTMKAKGDNCSGIPDFQIR